MEQREREKERDDPLGLHSKTTLFDACVIAIFYPSSLPFSFFSVLLFFFRLYFVPRREGRERIFDEKLIARWVCQTLESGGEMLFKDN